MERKPIHKTIYRLFINPCLIIMHFEISHHSSENFNASMENAYLFSYGNPRLKIHCITILSNSTLHIQKHFRETFVNMVYFYAFCNLLNLYFRIQGKTSLYGTVISTASCCPSTQDIP